MILIHADITLDRNNTFFNNDKVIRKQTENKRHNIYAQKQIKLSVNSSHYFYRFIIFEIL